MRVALTVWDGRISPVFDVATRLRLLDVEHGVLRADGQAELAAFEPAGRASELARLGVDRVVCGAISVPFGAALATWGIDVIPFVSGNADDAVKACVDGRLPNPDFAMPGCRQRRWRGGGSCRTAGTRASRDSSESGRNSSKCRD